MTAQQDFLRSAMAELRLTPEEFCKRLHCEQRTLGRWLLPTDSKEFIAVGDGVWALVRDILAHERSRGINTASRH